MPDANGQFQLQDFREELNARGFDGYTPAQLNTLINRGYFYIARKFEWYWRQTTANVVIPSNGQIDVADTGTLTGFKNIESVYVKDAPSAGKYSRIEAVNENEFRTKWWPPANESPASTQDTPEVYYIDGKILHILPLLTSPGVASVDLKYYRRPQALATDTAVSIMPVDLDEAILLAALVRCHKRANEFTNAAVATNDLDEMIDDLKDLEGTRMLDQQDRVIPDTSWA